MGGLQWEASHFAFRIALQQDREAGKAWPRPSGPGYAASVARPGRREGLRKDGQAVAIGLGLVHGRVRALDEVFGRERLRVGASDADARSQFDRPGRELEGLA